jgi:hypothetical protein
MPEPIQEKPIVAHTLSVTGGQNDLDEVHVLGETEAAVILNLVVDREGSRSRRLGVSSHGGRTNPPNGIWVADDSVLEQEVVFGVYGGRVYATPGGGALYQRASGFSLTDTLHVGVEGRYSFQRAIYVAQACQNDSDATLTSRLAVITYQNLTTQVTNIGAMAPCWFQNRLWLARDSYGGQPFETIWWSELGDGLSYSAYNTLQVEPGIGGFITQLLPLRGFTPSIVVFKERAIATVEPYWGSSSSLIPAAGDALDTIKTNIRIISPAIGCRAPLSIQFVPGAPAGDIYFLSNDGVRALTRANDDTINGVSKVISKKITSTIKRINFAAASKCVSEVFDNKYHLAVPLDGALENTHVLVFDLEAENWSVHDWKLKTMRSGRQQEYVQRLFAQYNTLTYDCSNTGQASCYHTFKLFAGLLDPNGSPVIFREDSRGMDFGGIDKKKKWDYASLSFRNDAASTAVVGLQYNVDKRGWVTCGSAVFGAIAGGLGVILGVTPLPWGITTGATRTFKFGLADVDPGYFIQIRYFGTSDLAQPVVLDLTVAARPIMEEFDNSIT